MSTMFRLCITIYSVLDNSQEKVCHPSKRSGPAIRNKDDKVITKVNTRLFTLNIKPESLKCLKAIIKDGSWLWSIHFGHFRLYWTKSSIDIEDGEWISSDLTSRATL